MQYRAKCSGVWEKGELKESHRQAAIKKENGVLCYIFPEDIGTISRCSSVIDKNGNELCQGDIICIGSEKRKAIIDNSAGKFEILLNGERYSIRRWNNRLIFKIGNIWDNPDLIPKNIQKEEAV